MVVTSLRQFRMQPDRTLETTEKYRAEHMDRWSNIAHHSIDRFVQRRRMESYYRGWHQIQ